MISQRQRENRLQKGSLCSPPGPPADVCTGSPYPGRTEGSVPPHPSLQTWMFRAVQHPAGAEPALEENSTGTACSPALKFSVNYIFHKSPVHTSHFWIASFPLRSQTISLWYNRLYFYINVSSCHEIYCLAGPIRLRRSSTVLWASQPSELHYSQNSLFPRATVLSGSSSRDECDESSGPLGGKMMLPPWELQQARSLVPQGLLFKGFARILQLLEPHCSCL